jgi:hypothetical protein
MPVGKYLISANALGLICLRGEVDDDRFCFNTCLIIGDLGSAIVNVARIMMDE